MHQPGDGWTYNAAYDVLGVLLARASGESLADVTAERVLEPLCIVDIGFHVPTVDRDRFTTLYRRDEQGIHRVSNEPDGARAATRKVLDVLDPATRRRATDLSQRIWSD